MTKLVYILALGLPMFGQAQEVEREPNAVLRVSSNHRRAYAGSADEEDLRVQPALPEAGLRVDARGLQREIFKQLYNQDLKEEQQNDLEE